MDCDIYWVIMYLNFL